MLVAFLSDSSGNIYYELDYFDLKYYGSFQIIIACSCAKTNTKTKARRPKVSFVLVHFEHIGRRTNQYFVIAKALNEQIQLVIV